jgi:hypothetical protein
MSRRVDLNTKLRLSAEDAAYALSISKLNTYKLFEKRVIVAVGGKVATKDVLSLVNRIYHPDFPHNIDNTEHRKLLIEVFCSQTEKYNHLKNIEA